jgi:hypothetical protein
LSQRASRNAQTVEVRKVVQKRVRRKSDGVDLVADVQAAIVANVGRRGSRSVVSTRQRSTTRQGGTATTPPPHDEEDIDDRA